MMLYGMRKEDSPVWYIHLIIINQVYAMIQQQKCKQKFAYLIIIIDVSSLYPRTHCLRLGTQTQCRKKNIWNSSEEKLLLG